MTLGVKTRGQSDPRGKPRVYFTCHPDDFDAAFPLISDDILRHANCAVWYDEDHEGMAEIRELLDGLNEMQLMVLAVTSKLLYAPSRARDVELPYALANHIPVLPIMLESGLAREFNRVTDTKLQVVSRYVTDPTATPYEDVLETYLKSVLIGDELAELVRDAFDAYVFLSYRKKDRRHAQRLMYLIHENRQFRDIAIWYDEFLVPGEQYNDAIRDAFEKSALFALAVTPNLLEPGNYVMETEYKLADRRRREKRDLEIVPVEMYDTEQGDPRTDREKLGEAYARIPDVQDEHDRPRMNAAFLKALARVSRKAGEGSARHRFFIGLAYLCGIDVEINPRRALSLIQSAANDDPPCLEATEKLVDMYSTGDGVARDISQAIAWQKKLCAQCRAEYEKGYSPDEHRGFGTRAFHALKRLSDMYREAGDIPGAEAAALEAQALGSTLVDEVGVREVERDTAMICNRLGGLRRELGDLDGALEHYERAYAIYDRLAREIGTARARRDLSISMERIGDIHRKRRDYDGAWDWYGRARQLRVALAGDGVKAQARRDLSAILTKLGDVRRAQRDYDGAARFYEEAVDYDRVLAQELDDDQAWDDYAVSLIKLGDICSYRMAYRDAVDHHLKAVKILEKCAERTGSLRFRRTLATALEKLAKSWNLFYQRECAEDCYRRALGLREALADEVPIHTIRHELATTCFLYADFSCDADLMRRALKLWQKMCPEHPEYRRYAENAERMLRRWL